MATREPVTVIGLGAMGSAMAGAFLAAGHPTTVWNRTPSRADALVARGATLAASPAEALAAAGVTVLSLVDYQAMYDILGTTDPAALDGRVLVNLSSDSPERLREAARWAAGHGAELLTGGIMVPPPGIGQPGAYTFYSGQKAALEAHRATLEVLSRVDHIGTDPGLAMLYYQAMLHIFWSTLTSYFHAAALLGTAGTGPAALRPYVDGMLADLASEGPMGFLGIVTREIEEGVYPGGENNLHMQAVGAEHIVHAFRDAGIDTGTATALRRLFAAADAAGHGADGLTSVIEVIKKPV
ncbi:NAD(P)-dependent oxidoreductase [Streptomyces specialis]|uniref:NAD(P)-dependent oxidoreductase n=1 Tax=Streptomyces specialis TaxID=498367 RepID=UPI00073F9F45|nr:NAD(P)-binding domain-containing protein [Streptomyces specialis]